MFWLMGNEETGGRRGVIPVHFKYPSTSISGAGVQKEEGRFHPAYSYNILQESLTMIVY
jgi:hypothetical protein